MNRLVWATFFLAASLASPAAPSGKPVKILLLVGGLYHDYDQLPQTLVTNLQGRFKDSLAAEFTVTKDLSVLRKDELSRYDVIMMNVCEQTPLSSEQKNGFLASVRNGMPVLALHCTFWSFQDWPEFKQILGAFVPGHGHYGAFCLQTVHPDSPILKGVQPMFQLTDEPYIVNDRDPSMEVLIETCQPIQGRQGHEPEVWTKMYGKGRIFAMTFGHDASSQETSTYLTLLSNGLFWALGR